MKRKNFVRILFFCWLVSILVIAYKYQWKDKSVGSGTNVGVKIESVNPTTGSVTTETSGITIVRDRGARLNFVPAKAGMSNGVQTGGGLNSK